jgi:integrase/recombinase XerD
LHYAIRMVLYGPGMRRTEASRFMVNDIDSERMRIHIRNGKGGRDRDVPVTPKLQAALRQYWLLRKPKVYLFPSKQSEDGAEEPISDKTVWYACREAGQRAGLTKNIGPHTLRHSFATHMLEGGADLRAIQLLPGHAKLDHTTVYLHLSRQRLKAAINPLD